MFSFIDLHAHSNVDAAFTLANASQDIEIQKLIRKFVRLYDIYSKNFDYNSCGFGKGKQIKSNLGIGKTKVAHETRCALSFTLESSYHKGTKEFNRYDLDKVAEMKKKKNNSYAYSLKLNDFEEVGISLRDVLLEMTGNHPCSLLNKTYFFDMDQLDKFIETEVKGTGDNNKSDDDDPE